MISPLYFCYALVGGAIQLGVIWLMRANGWPFLWVLPAILANQFLFTAAYAKAPNFVIQWFLTAAVTSLASLILGVTMFGDKLSMVNSAGILLVFVGVAMLKFG
jgi:multidrug transporter EmrE-like cation transporter